MKPKRRMNETQIENKAQSKADRIDQFQQRKLAEELTNGMALRKAALEQLEHKIAAEEINAQIITISAKAEDEEATTWAAKCAEQKQQYPSRTLCYHDDSVSLTLHAPQAGLSKQKSNRIVTSATATRSSCAL